MKLRLFNLICGAISLLSFTNAQVNSTFSPARPPAIPLAVKSPYLNAWQQAGSDGGNGGYLAGQWPVFWPGQIVGWAGLIRVDRYVYTWMGAPMTVGNSHGNHTPPVVNQTSFYYTSTRSVFNFDVGGMINLTVEFLSNVAPTDYKRQSLPFSYMNVEVVSLDGKYHAVQLYSDITAEWISGDRSAVAQWNYGIINNGSTSSAKKPRDTQAHPTAGPSPFCLDEDEDEKLASQQNQGSFQTYGTGTSYTGYRSAVRHTEIAVPTTSGYINPHATATPTQQKSTTTTLPGAHNTSLPSGIAYHRVFRQTQLLFSEISDQAEWGYWYYLTDNVKSLTHAIGEDVFVRSTFESDGYLPDVIDTDFRPINDSFPVFAFARDLGHVGPTNKKSVLWGLALAQEEAIQFEGANGNETLPSLWTSYFSDELDAMSFYYTDFAEASTQATNLDNQVASDSSAASGSNYTLMTSLAVRQAFAATYLTGTPNSTLVFLKEISSDGNVNTVDVIFPTHPILIYFNPTYLKQMLDPLFINQEAGYWPQQYAIHDIGSAYPNATGHNDGMDEMQPLEECGDMIIMTLAYAQRANDNAYLTQHYDILRQWNQYLIEEALIPMNQISTDDFAGALANQTNLAIKGIIGIEAMAQIANRTGHAVDGQNYTMIAHNYTTQWQSLGLNLAANPPHSTLAYGMNDTHGVLYNIYADKELGLNLVPQSVYDIQSNFYPTIFETYGVPLDTRHNWTKSDESMLAAAVASESTRNEFIAYISNWINVTPTNLGMTDLYDAVTGNYPVDNTTGKPIYFIARPVVGGFFSTLALKSAPQQATFPVQNTTAAKEC